MTGFCIAGCSEGHQAAAGRSTRAAAAVRRARERSHVGARCVISNHHELNQKSKRWYAPHASNKRAIAPANQHPMHARVRVINCYRLHPHASTLLCCCCCRRRIPLSAAATRCLPQHFSRRLKTLTGALCRRSAEAPPVAAVTPTLGRETSCLSARGRALQLSRMTSSRWGQDARSA